MGKRRNSSSAHARTSVAMRVAILDVRAGAPVGPAGDSRQTTRASAYRQQLLRSRRPAFAQLRTLRPAHDSHVDNTTDDGEQPMVARREVLSWACAASLWAVTALPAEAVQEEILVIEKAQDTPRTLTTDKFVIQVPAGFQREFVPERYDPKARRTTLNSTPESLPGFGPAPPANPLKLKLTRGRATISVATRFAKDIRPTFLQINDLSEFGGMDELTSLLVPKGAQLISASELLAATPKEGNAPDEPVPERTYLLFEFLTGGLRGYLMCVSKFGQVYVALAGTTGTWDENVAKELRDAAESFRIYN